MATTRQAIGIGATANDGTGDQLRTAFDKTNDNVNELYCVDDVDADTSILAGTVVRRTAPTLPHGVAGDKAGMIALADGFLYVCILDYVVGDGSVSWQRVAIAATSAGGW